MGRIKVLFIAGAGRSGSTLLGQILGQAKGFCFIGEAVNGGLGLVTRRCGCGVPIPECEFWTTVRREAVGGGRLLEASEFFGLGQRARWRHLPLTYGPGRDQRLESLYGEHWHGCERQYETVAAAGAAAVIVDSSKSVPYGRMLGVLPALDLYVVHVLRDPRAVTYSWKRWKPAPDQFGSPYMSRRGCLRAAAFWAFSNYGAEMFLRPVADGYLRLRYEDLIARPRQWLDRIFRMVAGRPVELPLVGEHTIDLRPSHSVKGNPDRLRTGPIELRLDDEWKTGMGPADRRVVTALTWPLLMRYGYLTGA
jgi:hypothetical protein